MIASKTIVLALILSLLPFSAFASREGVPSLLTWSKALREEGKAEIAEVGIEAAIDRSPTWVLPYLDRAELAIQRNEGIRELRSEISALQARSSQNPRFHRILGQLAVLDGDDEAAVSAFARSLELRPQQPETRAERAAALGRLGRHAEAADEYGRAVQELPNDNAIRSRYADALEAAGRHKEARKELELLVRRLPDREAPLRQLARFLERRGDKRGAAAANAKADRLSPGGERNLRPLPASSR